jgi:hypothetical protein
MEGTEALFEETAHMVSVIMALAGVVVRLESAPPRRIVCHSRDEFYHSGSI